jgi:hypothetical protein
MLKQKQLFGFCVGSLFLFSLILFTACKEPSSGPTINPEGKTLVKFTNLEQYRVVIYGDSLRNSVLTEIPGYGEATIEAEPNPGGTAFYPTFYLNLFGKPGITIPCDAQGKAASIIKNQTTRVTIPKLTLEDMEKLNFAYIEIINNSQSTLTLKEGNEKAFLPKGNYLTIINENGHEVYEISPGDISRYGVMANVITPVQFPQSLTEFRKGIIYVMTYNGANILVEEKPVLHLVFPPPSNLIITALSENSVAFEWNSVNWTANGYNVYRSTGVNETYTKVNSNMLMEPKYIDTGLTPFTTYYYKVSANSVNFESLQLNPISVSTGINVPGNNLISKLDWLKNNAANNNLYFIEVDTDEFIVPQNLSYSGKNGISIILTGNNIERTITLTASGNLFTVGSGVIFTLGNNIKLAGRSNNTGSLVYISANGTMIMNEGSKITGNTYSSDYVPLGGGVHIVGNFIMNGGEISNNKIFSSKPSEYSSCGGGVYVNGTFTMNGGKISGNSSLYGAGVYVDTAFTMTGGEISGNSSSRYGGGIFVDDGYEYIPGYGTRYRNVSFLMSGGVIYGNSASTSLRNTATASGAALFRGAEASRISVRMQYGTFSGNTFYSSGDLNTTNTTTRVVNGNLLTN